MSQSKLKNIVIILFEIATILLMVFNVLPREASWFLTGLLIFYFLFSDIEDSLWVFIVSIPLFIALPIKGSFDTLANWRILSIVLFLVVFFKQGISFSLVKDKFGKWELKENLEHYRSEYLKGIFILIAFLSLFIAQDVFTGLKKIIFLVNAFLIYIVIRNIVFRKKEILKTVINAVKTAIGITLGIGFLQLGMIFFMNLHQFWHLWDRGVIDVFYGQALSNLLSYSNTWFSYYSYQLPTLRMFSVFPDSHSFAVFCILSLSIFLSLVFLKKKKWPYLLLILCFLAIIFSGSRAAWASAIGMVLLITFSLPFIYRKYKKQTQLALGSLVMFFVLFPIAAAILFIPQYIELGREATMGISFFERSRSIFDFDEASVKSRLEIWQKTADSIILNPVLGVGIGNYPVVLGEKLSAAKKGSSAHSLYLDFTAEIGVFGLLVFLAIIWYIIKDAWNIFSQADKSFIRIWAGFFMFALIWVLGYSVFDVVLLNDKVLLFFAVNLGILYGAKSTLNFN